MQKDNFKQLHHEVEAELVRWKDRLDVPVDSALINRTKSTVQREVNEAWLAEQPTTKPSPLALEQTRMAVHKELNRRRRLGKLRKWSLVGSAAAAILVISFSTAWFSSTAPTSTGKTLPPATGQVALFVESAEKILDEDSQLLAIEMALENLETDISLYTLNSGIEEQMLDDLGNDIDSLFENIEWSPSEEKQSTSKTTYQLGGYLG
jgi:hypothetical protein